MPCLQVRAVEQTINTPAFPTAKARGEQNPKESYVCSTFGWGKEGKVGRQLLLCICCSTASENPGQANSMPIVVSTLKINLPATAETSLHSSTVFQIKT